VKGEPVRESSGTENPKEARKLLRQRLSEVDSGELRSGDRIRLADLYQALERDYVINRRKDLVNLKSRWALHMKPVFGEMLAAEVAPSTVALYITKRLSDEASNATINRELSNLKRMYKLAVKSGQLKLGQQPYIEMLKERNVRKGFVKDDQYEALAQATANVGLWLRAMMEVAYTYGWRKSELLSRKVQHFDISERTLSLDPGETKNGEGRIVHLTGKAYELLRQCAEGKEPEQYLFTRERDRRGRHPRSESIVDFREDWTIATDAARCPGLLFHDLRRTAVRNMVNAGLDSKTAMLHSGHRNRSVFDRYHIVNERDLKQAAAKMEQAARERREHAIFEHQQDMNFGPSTIEPPKNSSQTSSPERLRSVIESQASKPN
jgi:integrase